MGYGPVRQSTSRTGADRKEYRSLSPGPGLVRRVASFLVDQMAVSRRDGVNPGRNPSAGATGAGCTSSGRIRSPGRVQELAEIGIGIPQGLAKIERVFALAEGESLCGSECSSEWRVDSHDSSTRCQRRRPTGGLTDRSFRRPIFGRNQRAARTLAGDLGAWRSRHLSFRPSSARRASQGSLPRRPVVH